MNLDSRTAQRIGSVWLRAAIAPVGDFGRRAQDAAPPFGPGDEAAAHARCRHIVDLAQTLTRDGVARIRAALRRAPDPGAIVSRARAGDAVSDVDIFEVGRFADALEATASAWDAAGGAADGRPPVLPGLRAVLEPGRAAGTFYLADAFAPALARARAVYADADAALAVERGRLAQALVPLLGALPDTEEFIVMRDVLPVVPAGVRVLRETPAYRTFALALDASALEVAARREACLADVTAQEDAVRRALADAIAAAGEEILAAMRHFGELDRTLARVAFTQRWGGCVPTFASDRLAFDGASFLPLREALADAGHAYTPLSLDLRGAAVLTGPNMGGKSAALATCGFLALCAAHGVPPPATRATLPLMASIAWIGGDSAADRARLLSSFGGEVVRARDVLEAAGRPELLLVDEFARTTGPREGRALLVAFVEALAQRGAFALVATHFDGVARDAGVAHLAIAGLGERSFEPHAARDIHAALDAVAQAMDYRVVPVASETGSHSDALALAKLLGLDPTIVDRAQTLFAQPDAPGGVSSSGRGTREEG